MTRLEKNEWRKGYPLKKIIICLLWFSLFLATVGMGVEYVMIETESGHLSGVIVPALILLATIGSGKRYLQKKYHAMPYLYTVLNEDIINDLLDEEVYKIDMFKECGIYNSIRESKHWLVVNGVYVLKDLAVECKLCPKGTGGMNSRWTTHFMVTYLTGESINIDTGRKITELSG